MTAWTRLRHGYQRLSAVVRRRTAIDLRALAAFRIALGTLLLANLLTRANHLTAFYTDSGAFPRETLLATHDGANQVFAYIGDPWGPILLFPVAGVFALAVLVGYRTRVATAVSLVLLILLHLRNPLVLNSGDLLFRSLLVWALFLPLDRRWAIDARRYDTQEGTVSSVATVAVLTQVVIVYSVNAVHKLDGKLWRNGQAIPHIFQADQLTYLLGDVLAEMPGLLVPFTYAWMALVITAPLLIVLTGRARALFASLFVGMHLGMAVSMPIGLFPFISISGLILFYPPVAWNTAENVGTRLGIGTRPRIWAARIEDAVGPSRRWLPQDSRLERVSSLGQAAIPALVFSLVLLSAGSTIGGADLPEPVDQTIDTANLEQRWQMFAPHPVRTTRWFAFPANRTDGAAVDAFRGGSAALGRPPDAADTIPSNRWRKFLQAVEEDTNGTYRTALADYLCTRWNQRQATDIESVAIYQGYERTDPYTGEVQASGGRYLLRYDCARD